MQPIGTISATQWPNCHLGTKKMVGYHDIDREEPQHSLPSERLVFSKFPMAPWKSGSPNNSPPIPSLDSNWEGSLKWIEQAPLGAIRQCMDDLDSVHD